MRGIKLHKYCFIGVFAIDDIPNDMKNNDCFIFNNQTHKQKGEHWLSGIKQGNKIYFYDSFGRPASYFGLNKNYIQSNPNREEEYNEVNCGARSISWLITSDIFGVEAVHNLI